MITGLIEYVIDAMIEAGAEERRKQETMEAAQKRQEAARQNLEWARNQGQEMVLEVGKRWAENCGVELFMRQLPQHIQRFKREKAEEEAMKMERGLKRKSNWDVKPSDDVLGLFA